MRCVSVSKGNLHKLVAVVVFAGSEGTLRQPTMEVNLFSPSVRGLSLARPSDSTGAVVQTNNRVKIIPVSRMCEEVVVRSFLKPENPRTWLRNMDEADVASADLSPGKK